jgi:hypothetical protein
MLDFRNGVNKSLAGRLFGTAEDPQKADRIVAHGECVPIPAVSMCSKVGGSLVLWDVLCSINPAERRSPKGDGAAPEPTHGIMRITRTRPAGAAGCAPTRRSV